MFELLIDQTKRILYNRRVLFVLGSLGFLFLIYYGITRKNELVYAIPFLMAGAYIGINNFRNLWYLAVFFMPLSINLAGALPGGLPSVGITFPTDLVSLGLCALVLAKMVIERKTWSHLYNHSLFWLVAAWVAWMGVTTITSEIPMVSLKWTVSMVWIIGTFYFVSTLIFSKPKAIVHFFWLIGLGFSLAMLVIIAKYAMQGRNPFGLRFNPTPVFNDHTVFGGFTTFFVPIFTLFIFSGRFSKSFRWASAGLLMFILMGLFFSYSRGAWASTFMSLVLMVLVMNRHYLRKFLIPISLLVLIMGGLLWNYTSQQALRSDAVSRESFEQHIRSITNFKTDNSNTERINRWMCSIEMWKERPVVGFGPGTYTFLYANFQESKHRTPVSTNHGDNGSAHNEWLLALSEMGLPGFILAILLFLWPLYCGLRGYFKTKEPNLKLIYLGVTFGMFTYFLHAFVNNFLDQDKVGVPFFGILAIITALDLYRYRNREA